MYCAVMAHRAVSIGNRARFLAGTTCYGGGERGMFGWDGRGGAFVAWRLRACRARCQGRGRVHQLSRTIPSS